MRNLHALDKHRVLSPFHHSWGDETCGAFLFNRKNQELRVLASQDDDWDHVSVSLKNRCPNWEEMDYIKRLFFEDNELCVQFHVPVDRHISLHPFCLHLWRNKKIDYPLPPAIYV